MNFTVTLLFSIVFFVAFLTYGLLAGKTLGTAVLVGVYYSGLLAILIGLLETYLLFSLFAKGNENDTTGNAAGMAKMAEMQNVVDVELPEIGLPTDSLESLESADETVDLVTGKD